jgi:hypothetical protein
MSLTLAVWVGHAKARRTRATSTLAPTTMRRVADHVLWTAL